LVATSPSYPIARAYCGVHLFTDFLLIAFEVLKVKLPGAIR